MNVPSSNVEAIMYHQKSRELIVTYRGGREYVYRDVPPEIWAGIEAAESVGRYLHEFVKGQYEYERKQ